MKKQKSNSLYIKIAGITWIILATIASINREILKDLQAIFGYDQFATLLTLCIVFLPGAVLLSFGILLSERSPDLKPLRVTIFTLIILIVSLIVYSWVNFAVNFKN